MKGAIYYEAIAMVIFSHVKITCYFHMWRYQVFAQKLTWYFIGVYIIIFCKKHINKSSRRRTFEIWRPLECFVLALSCFGSSGSGLASPGRSTSASVPELSCRDSQLFSFLEVLGNNSCNPFYRWFFWSRTKYALMLSFFIVKFPAGQCLMMYDDRYWDMETHVSCMSL